MARRKANFFGVLGDDDDEASAFRLAAPSLLAVPAAGYAPAAAPPPADNDGSDSDDLGVGSGAPPPPPPPTARAWTSLSGGVDLGTLAAEIGAQAAALPLPASAAAWDFSGIAATASAEAQRSTDDAAAAATDAQLLHEARMAALESDRGLMRDRLARADISKRNRRRVLDGVGRGEDHGTRLGSKVFKREEKSSRRNKAKHAW